MTHLAMVFNATVINVLAFFDMVPLFEVKELHWHVTIPDYLEQYLKSIKAWLDCLLINSSLVNYNYFVCMTAECNQVETGSEIWIQSYSAFSQSQKVSLFMQHFHT